MTKSRINIEVTEADIERAHRNDSYKCVVAQAIARTVSTATSIEVDTQTVRFTVDGERRIYLTPYVVAGYVIAFDAGDPIEPFSFQLRDPKRARRRVKTEAGKAADRAATAAAKAERSKEGPSAPARAPHDLTRTAEETQAAQVAYAQARAAQPGKGVETDRGGRKPPPRVFKTKKRSYGHRLLRINQEEAK